MGGLPALAVRGKGGQAAHATLRIGYADVNNPGLSPSF